MKKLKFLFALVALALASCAHSRPIINLEKTEGYLATPNESWYSFGTPEAYFDSMEQKGWKLVTYDATGRNFVFHREALPPVIKGE